MVHEDTLSVYLTYVGVKQQTEKEEHLFVRQKWPSIVEPVPSVGLGETGAHWDTGYSGTIHWKFLERYCHYDLIR